MKHTIRTSENGRVELDLTPGLAMKLKCMDCMGWEAHPKDCTSVLCPLYPYRGRTLLSMHGYKPRELTKEQKAQAAERLRKIREGSSVEVIEEEPTEE